MKTLEMDLEKIQTIAVEALEHYMIVDLTADEAMILLSKGFSIHLEGTSLSVLRRAHVFTN